MVLLEREETIKPLSKREKVRLLHFLIDELAEEKSQDEHEEMIDAAIFDERITESDQPLSFLHAIPGVPAKSRRR